MSMQSEDLTGKKFNRLTGVRKLHKNNKEKRWVWEFICDCGNKVEAVTHHVKAGGISSCGCFQKERIIKYNTSRRILTVEEVVYRRVIKDYKIKCRKRNVLWSLNYDDCEKLFSSNCFYCGSSPSNKGDVRDYHDAFFYNGIDRLTPKLGYVKDNVVSCCKTCNLSLIHI